MTRSRSILLAAPIVLALAGAAVACPNCKDTIANTDAAGSPGVAAAFNTSIYFMLGVLLIVITLVVRVIVKAIRESDRSIHPSPKPSRKDLSPVQPS